MRIQNITTIITAIPVKIIKKIREFFHPKDKICVLRLDGVIGASGRFGRGLNDVALAPLIEKAFDKKPKAVVLAINSPGGSPVQSSLIAARILRKSADTKIPVYAFCEDVAASGGYWLACAASEIYADDSSIIGSIGVISASFGLHKFIEKQGIERRIHTAGKNKSLADPFKAQKPEQVRRLKALQKTIHDNFIDYVKSRRGKKLKKGDLFNGDVWLGQAAVKMGLIDGVGHLVPMMQERFGKDVRFTVIGQKKSLMGRFGARSLSSEAMAGAIDSLEENSLWARYGL